MIESKSKSIWNWQNAEFCFDKKLGKPVLFLWLPLWRFREKEAIGRTKVWTDGNTVSYLGHVKEGIGKIKLMSEWESMPVNSRPINYLSSTRD